MSALMNRPKEDFPVWSITPAHLNFRDKTHVRMGTGPLKVWCNSFLPSDVFCLSIYLGYDYPVLNVALLMFFPSTPVFCLSRPCRTDGSSNIISPSLFFLSSLLLFPSNLSCHSINLFVHLLSFLWATCPSHLLFDCLILIMISVTPVWFLMAGLQFYHVSDP